VLNVRISWRLAAVTGVLALAETDPAHSVVATVSAGCSPVRVITS
jgi:hypothetical protein